MIPEPLLSVRELRKVYRRRPALLRQGGNVDALAGISFELWRGETLAIVGRSGSGKSTLARCLSGHTSATSGHINLGARRVSHARPDPRIQLIFQDSPAALNPHWTGLQLLGEPLRIQGLGEGAGLANRISDLADRVELPRRCLYRTPGEMSGGQRQRLAIARALAIEPVDLLILDEPLRGLDAVSKNQLWDLLANLQAPEALSMLYITHDLSDVRRIAQRIMVLDAGRVAESGSTLTVLSTPEHPATRALVQAILLEPPCVS